MAQNAYLALTGQKLGDIKGSVTQRGFENLILVTAVRHGLLIPRDPVSGLPTGKRMHKPFAITKQLDKSSPILYQAMITNENITRFELRFYTQTQSTVGALMQNYSIRLTNASIADIEFTLPDTTDPALTRLSPFEEISFSYQKIEWQWTDGGIMATDTWGA